MNFIKHLNLEGKHAAFGASKSAWLRYSDEKAIEVYSNLHAKEEGTKLHKWAKDTIDLRIKQPRSKKTLYSYINDAIGYKMSTEVVLYYSDLFFGTADAISFRNNMLRIHDLKTGKKKADIEQLMIYAALFCLEYKVKPSTITIELRIYQNDEILYHIPEPEDISDIMERIIKLNNIFMKYDSGEA